MSAAAELAECLSRIVPAHRQEWGDDGSFEAQLAWQRRLAAEGWAVPSWPTEFGGRGLGPAERVECDRLIAEAGVPPLAGVLGLQNVGPALIMFGTPEQQASLPRIVSGEELWVQGFSEPEAGSDLAGLRTQATVGEDGFVVNGQKIWTTNGMEATHMLLLARTDREASKHKGISALLVDLSSPGIERRAIRQLTGEEGFAEIFFTDVPVPAENLLGPLHGGWGVTVRTLGYERTGVINQAARLEREVTEVVRTLQTADPLLRDELTRRWIDARLVGLMGRRALERLQEGEDPGPEQSIIKFAWSLASSELGETVLKAAGMGGLVSDAPAVNRFLRSRSATIAAGTTEIMRNLLAERVLGLPRER